MMRLTASSQIRRNGDILHVARDAEVVMMSIKAGAYYGLEEVGARIWEMIAEPMTAGDICMRLAEEYNVASDLCEVEVLTFLNELRNQGIIDVIAE